MLFNTALLLCMKDWYMLHSFTYSKRKGFILYVVCALAIGLFILISSLNSFKSGAVLQLSKNVTQERMIVVAQSAINETLAAVKGGINNVGTSVGSAVKDYWTNKKSAPAIVWSASFAESNLPITKDIAGEYLGSKGNVASEIKLYADEQIKEAGTNSYTGHIVIVGKVSCDGVKDAVSITEVHDVKITDLSYPLLDKYALFVKSYCSNLNDPEKQFIIEGVPGKNKESYSFVYLGNRNYPSCTEYPQGGAKHPPVLLDLDFEKDKDLLGVFYQENAGFNLKDNELSQLSKGKFFKTYERKFSEIQSHFDIKTDFYKTKELEYSYRTLVESCRKNLEQAFALYGPGVYNSNVGQIWKDYNNAGGNPQNAEIFWAIVYDVVPTWKYFYGYTDYKHIYPYAEGSIGGTYPFNGLVSYFQNYSTKNKSKTLGGTMPEFFNVDRNRPVYIDGPVYIRFFKIGLLDETTINLKYPTWNYGVDVPVNHVSCVWERPEDKTFSSKYVGDFEDGITERLMSHPVDWISINNFFFGPAENIDNKDSIISGGMKGYNVFHHLDSKLRTVSNFYLTADDFKKDRIKNINGESVLDLDGISIIYGKDKAKLDLSDVKKYRGKGMIVSYMGNCVLGDLMPSDQATDYLKIWLMRGRFFVDEIKSSATIFASLISTVGSGDNSSIPVSQEGGFFTKKVPTTIVGNLIIDNLFDMRDKKYLKITHDPKIYNGEYPVRVSVGGPKAEYVLNYKGKD